MEAPINEIIKNIIHIDKNAVQLREKLNREIGDKKLQTNSQIEKLRASILEAEIERIEETEKEEKRKAELEAEDIRLAAIEKGNKIYNNFLSSKDELIKEIFKNIISI